MVCMIFYRHRWRRALFNVHIRVYVFPITPILTFWFIRRRKGGASGAHASGPVLLGPGEWGGGGRDSFI